MFKFILASWSPNAYHKLREAKLSKVVSAVALAAAFSMLLFVLLCLPSILRADEAARSISQSTNLTLSASLEQTEPAYILRNPDVVIAPSDLDAFVTITPEALYFNKFIYFGREAYVWKDYSTLSTVPAADLAMKLTLLLLPSIVFWGALFITLNALFLSVLYSLIAFFILQSKEYVIGFSTIWKIALYASIPALCIFAFTPMLRLGLPVSVIIGLMFVVWLVFCLLGTALLTEKQLQKRKPGA
jgi:hypothetical protein